MKLSKLNLILFFALIFSFISTVDVYSGHDEISETDGPAIQLSAVYDLRDRESYVQVTNTDTSGITVHVQIFNVDDNCNENNFYDTLTPNDTHVYNLMDIETNNGAPSGVVLPDDAYGMVVVTYVLGVGMNSVANEDENKVVIGNFRILDVNGYEYRTNMAGYSDIDNCVGTIGNIDDIWTFNFNTESGITFADITVISFESEGSNDIEVNADPLDAYESFDVDIYDLNEVPFSCRNVIYACIDQDSLRLPELLEVVGDASVASFEYGINDVLPSSKGAPLLCPGNNIEEGFVMLEEISHTADTTYGFVGLNNGNGRGSIDAWFSPSCTLPIINLG